MFAMILSHGVVMKENPENCHQKNHHNDDLFLTMGLQGYLCGVSSILRGSGDRCSAVGSGQIKNSCVGLRNDHTI